MGIFGIVVLILVGGILLAVAFIYLAPQRVARFMIEGGRKRAGLARKQIDLPNGLRYVYLEGGTGEPLLLLHGFGANKDNFALVAGELAKRYRLIIPDHIGFGESSHPQDADYAPPAQVERLHALMQALGIARMHIGGSSMGGQIAMSYAAAHPDQVASLWLLDPAGVWSATPSELLIVKRETGRNLLMASNPEEFAAVIKFVTAKPPFIPGPVMKVLAQERIANYALEGRIGDQLLADSVEARVAGMQTPALIVWGDQDRAIHVDSAQVLHRLLPKSQVMIMAGVGHLPHFEQPQPCVAAYLRFRDGV
ncbi:pimeloyl-ACP methyl ester carboxylesterase [Povalibacter uvarum]|uniref:Pimeloyl-ACP methyl ester carboxylesterase n=1 Tax=Povalibacter uvarum TaxID=732238 RepID=A0A841HLU4_9GAMM|nr:alpha/beta fold hydrolase [Povalibacter uvarum]MBB6093329.1 pimeloyl-ACP methyl ester carboxylesterase [Povalibacter uvarum]